ncbi:MAG: hypothetical protein ACP5OE_09655 [Thermodesulfobium sp.]
MKKMKEIFEEIYQNEIGNFSSDFIDSGYSVRFNKKEKFYLLKIWFELDPMYRDCDYYPIVSILYSLDTMGRILDQSGYADWL